MWSCYGGGLLCPQGPGPGSVGWLAWHWSRKWFGLFEPFRLFLCFNVCSSKLFNLRTQSTTPDNHFIPTAPAASATFAALLLLFLSLSCFLPSYSSHPKLQPHISRVERWGSNNVQHFPKVAPTGCYKWVLQSPQICGEKKMNLLNTEIPALCQEVLKPQTFTGSTSIREKEEKETTSLHCMLYSQKKSGWHAKKSLPTIELCYLLQVPGLMYLKYSQWLLISWKKIKKKNQTGAGLYLKFPPDTQGNAIIQVGNIYFYHLWGVRWCRAPTQKRHHSAQRINNLSGTWIFFTLEGDKAFGQVTPLLDGQSQSCPILMLVTIFSEQESCSGETFQVQFLWFLNLLPVTFSCSHNWRCGYCRLALLRSSHSCCCLSSSQMLLKASSFSSSPLLLGCHFVEPLICRCLRWLFPNPAPSSPL